MQFKIISLHGSWQTSVYDFAFAYPNLWANIAVVFAGFPHLLNNSFPFVTCDIFKLFHDSGDTAYVIILRSCHFVAFQSLFSNHEQNLFDYDNITRVTRSRGSMLTSPYINTTIHKYIWNISSSLLFWPWVTILSFWTILYRYQVTVPHFPHSSYCSPCSGTVCEHYHSEWPFHLEHLEDTEFPSAHPVST